MNQELKQRLIGAVVVTALAAIFIPMLFDDPIENSGQSVSELAIPETPVNTGEESANKLPTSANQVLNTPDEDSGSVVDTEEEAELSADNEPPQEAPILEDEPIADIEAGSGQTIDEPIDDHSSKGKSTSKPASEADTLVEAPNKPLKKTEISAKKPASKVKPSTMDERTEKAVAKPVKPKTELSRWYIQAGSFSKKENALSLMETLRKQGLPVTMEASKGLYRLKVGPSLEKKRAIEMKAKLDSQKIQSFLIAE